MFSFYFLPFSQLVNLIVQFNSCSSLVSFLHMEFSSIVASLILCLFRQKRQDIKQKTDAVDVASVNAFRRVAPVASLYCLLFFF